MGTPVKVVMPQIGDKVTEGTITRWLVEVGAVVERDQPLFEVSTDKVDAEVPSPSEGVLSRVLCPEGTTIPVGESLVLPASAPDSAFVADCGVLVYTQHGVLPAVQLDDSFGFHNWSSEQQRWYSRDEVLRKLGRDYEIVFVAADQGRAADTDHGQPRT